MTQEEVASVSATINEESTSPVTRLHFKVVLKAEDGAPLSGEEIVLTLEGDGSFAPNFKSEQIKRETNEAGEAQLTWYRRSIFGRDVKATITATAPRSDCNLSLESTEDATPKLNIDFVARQIRITPPRA